MFSKESILPAPINDGNTWGKWRVEDNGRYLVYTGICKYEIPLFKITNNDELVGWLNQLSEKTWCSAEDLGNLVRAFEETLSIQKSQPE
jgi:hypothetical protein